MAGIKLIWVGKLFVIMQDRSQGCEYGCALIERETDKLDYNESYGAWEKSPLSTPFDL